MANGFVLGGFVSTPVFVASAQVAHWLAWPGDWSVIELGLSAMVVTGLGAGIGSDVGARCIASSGTQKLDA